WCRTSAPAPRCREGIDSYGTTLGQASLGVPTVAASAGRTLPADRKECDVSLMPPADLATRLASGLLSFPVTHFDAELNVEEPRYRGPLAWQASYDIAGLFAGGGTGEGFSLTMAEVDAVVRAAV